MRLVLEAASLGNAQAIPAGGGDGPSTLKVTNGFARGLW